MIDRTAPTVTVEKPWGKFEQYTHNASSTVKVITVRPGGALSLQYHHKRDELWVVLDKGAQVKMDDQVIYPLVGEKVFIPRMMGHRLSAIGDASVRVLEVSFGEFDEKDIIRMEDFYGRAQVRNGCLEAHRSRRFRWPE